ncbi:hypothetical protein VSS74_04670 [Conexibacter stalactiti]|uniref:Uncharacterized protein n=1 Tax=Conexibacter stalactiti TaxID=1940611 RepID=A0ABU4HJX8_9ACTN|nr:hypothetical protein [Conexibacter stalactiti]MDW5593616.1 hypothetical protein [Conexibacter stalactiti]MEC5034257.1 hypothetical protein [Conexibacter stalactiti]
MKFVPPRALVAALLALLLPCAFAASANAFAIDDVRVTTSAPTGGDLPPSGSDAAGAHPNQSTVINFSDAGRPTADSVQDLQLRLAPGIVAAIGNVRLCTAEQFGTGRTAPSCPAGSQVGETSTVASAAISPIPLTLPGEIYNIEPPAGSPAAFGIWIPNITGSIKLVAPIGVNPSNLGLTATLRGLPDDTLGGTVPLHIDSITQTLYGYVGGRPFFTNPTSCIPAAVGVVATSHDGVTAENGGSYTPNDCENVPFSATLATAADPSTPDSTSAISFNVQPAGSTPVRDSSHVRGTTVIAPPGTLLNSSLAAGLDACTDAGFQKDNTAVEANCPPSSRVGSIEFISPILGRFPGTVYFGTQTATDRLRLFLDVPLFGAHIKVSATVNPDTTTGQITTKFSDLPQIAFTSFRLTFAGGPRSALVTPTTCGENVSQAIVTPWSGFGEARPTASFRTDGDCQRRFTPTMGTAVANPQGGATTAFTLTFDRPDRTVPVGRVSFDLPPGLIGSLALRGLTKCSLANAAAGNCEASSRIGSVQSIVGSGSEPPTLPGSIYLTEPKVAGDPAGLSIKVPARLGPVDAGTVIVGQRLLLGQDGGLDVISDPIPALQFGIPLAIRRLIVTIDRDGFMRNPSSCGEKPANGVFEPLGGGANATASSTIAVTGCERLPFAPQIRGTIGGRGLINVGKQPAFTTTITQRGDEAAMKSAVVTLPRAISTNLPTIKAACEPAAYAAGRCPARSQVATATAVSPLISRPLTGPTYLVRVPTGGLPRLGVQLRGEVSLDLDGIVTIRNGLVVTTFGAIPDLALSSFELAFRGGPEGVLSTVGDLCAAPPLTAAFSGQNGKSQNRTPGLIPLGCTAPRSTASLRFRRGRGALTVTAKVPRGAKPMATVAVALPRGLSLSQAAVSAKAGGKRAGRRALRIRGRVASVKLPKSGASSVTLRVKGIGAKGRLARRLAARRGRLSVRVVTRQTNKAKATQSVRVKLR